MNNKKPKRFKKATLTYKLFRSAHQSKEDWQKVQDKYWEIWEKTRDRCLSGESTKFEFLLLKNSLDVLNYDRGYINTQAELLGINKSKTVSDIYYEALKMLCGILETEILVLEECEDNEGSKLYDWRIVDKNKVSHFMYDQIKVLNSKNHIQVFNDYEKRTLEEKIERCDQLFLHCRQTKSNVNIRDYLLPVNFLDEISTILLHSKYDKALVRLWALISEEHKEEEILKLEKKYLEVKKPIENLRIDLSKVSVLKKVRQKLHVLFKYKEYKNLTRELESLLINVYKTGVAEKALNKLLEVKESSWMTKTAMSYHDNRVFTMYWLVLNELVPGVVSTMKINYKTSK